MVRRRQWYHRQNPRVQRLRPTRWPAARHATGAGSSARARTRRCAVGAPPAGAAACETRQWRRRPDEKAASRGVEGAGAEAAAAAVAGGSG